MDANIKAQWLKALRSGEYQQTIGRLQSPDGKAYCCLGVLEHCVLGVEYDDEYREIVFDIDDLSTRVRNPSLESLAKAGLDKQLVRPLWNANDIGESFEQIAARIESTL